MRRKLLTLSLLMMGVCGWAQSGHETTTDHFVISELQLKPGAVFNENTDFITFSLDGSRQYSTFGADLYLPDGFEWAADQYGENAYIATDAVMFNTGRGGVVSTHSVGYNIQPDGAMRITIAPTGTGNMSFKANSGALFDIFVKATPFAKPGQVSVQIKNCYFSTEAGIQYDTNDITISDKVSASTSATAPLSVNSTAKWSTCVLPFATEIPSGVTAYTVSNSDAEYLYLTEAESIAAYTPYILKAEGEDGFSGNVSGTVNPALYPESGVVSVNGLNGAITLQDVTEGYVLQNGTEGVKFYPIGSGDHFSLKPGKCWMSPDASGSKGMGFSVVDPSGVKNVAAEIADGALYTLDGKKVVTPVAGQIYVKNGKKVLKK